MAPRRPPDILRKSHAHTEGRQRSKEKDELREAVDDALAGDLAERALLIDLDGVVYCGDEVVAGAPEAIAWLEDRHVPYLFVTNTTSRPPAALVEKLAGFGIATREDRILAPPDAAAAWLAELGKPAPEFFEAALGRLGTPPAAAAMIGDDIRADIDGAQQAGLAGVLVKTGKYRYGDLELGIEPELVIDSIAELPEAWPALALHPGPVSR